MNDLQRLAKKAHETSAEKGFWDQRGDADVAVKIALIGCEASELLEAFRLPDRTAHCGKSGCDLDVVEEELADVLIRTLDLCHFLGVDPEAVVLEKMAYNATRPAKHGKRF